MVGTQANGQLLFFHARQLLREIVRGPEDFEWAVSQPIRGLLKRSFAQGPLIRLADSPGFSSRYHRKEYGKWPIWLNRACQCVRPRCERNE